ncbi:mycothiol synthase [Kribbella sp. VKM Ac-2527]|uniref:Mycothiol acetyltransferase n=1 Tax=Kribbella caucasensis TaxID=2512215 RepID=A0A4R6JH77_9ACTN|nr:mycothiol synthase [Kribbella sp. VKM Ac-2527]TDO34401.1 mycothiol synthase [Kribbella sp. VKM Ac-2527]
MTLEAVPSPLPPATAAAVTELARAAAQSDGVNPLSERTLLHLDGEHPGDLHVLAYIGEPGTLGVSGLQTVGDLVGYASLAPDSSAQLVVAPRARRQGTGTALLRLLLDHGGPGLRVWAHGRLPGSDELAARLGLGVTRELYFLRRMSGPLPKPVWPDGIAVRTFEPGRDETAWLGVNARAFAEHPEQGSWTSSDLADRMGQPWFDPRGFFLAVESETGAVAGFHWTKVEDSVGEVYVVGVDPAYQGSGLGKALTIEGLRHLQEDRGLSSVVLYVDGTNTAARALYEKLGFTTAALDVQFGPSDAL